MIGYVILLEIALILWYLCYMLSDYELLAPGPIIFLGFIVSVVLAIVGIGSWNSYVLNDEVLGIVSFGFMGVLCACFIAKCLRLQYKRIGRRNQLIEKYITPNWKYIFLTVIVLTAVFIRIRETVELGESLGLNTSNYSNLSRQLRETTSTLFSADAATTGVQFSLIERQLEKFVFVTGFVSTYLLAYNLLKRRRTSVALSITLFISCSMFQIVAGVRGAIFYWLISLFVFISILVFRNKNSFEKLRFSVKLIAFGAIAAIICSIFMYFAGSLVGRRASSSLVEYISFYFGGSIPSLQILNESPAWDAAFKNGNINLLYNVFLLLNKTGVIDRLPAYSIAWIDCGGHASNIFTCFARYYFSCGFIGVFVLSTLSTLFITFIYDCARKKDSPVLVVIAGFLCAFAFDSAREEFIFSRLISSTYVVDILIMMFIVLFMTRTLLISNDDYSLYKCLSKREHTSLYTKSNVPKYTKESRSLNLGATDGC